MTDKNNLKTNLQLIIAIVAVTFIMTGYLRGRPKPWPAEAIERCDKGYALSKAGRDEEAIAYFSDAIRLAPKYDYPFRARGWSFYKLRRYNEALNDYNKSIELAPSAESFYRRAVIHDSMQNFQAVIKDIETANRHNPTTILQGDLDYIAGIAHLRLKHWEKASHFLNLSIKPYDHWTYDQRIAQRTAQAYFWLGEVRRQQKKYSLALSDYNRSIELDPKYAPAYYVRARLYDAQNKWIPAVDDYTAVIKIDPNFYQAYLGRGWAYYKLGDAVNAERDYNRLIQLNKYAKYAHANRKLSRKLPPLGAKAAADLTAARKIHESKKVETSSFKWPELEKEMAKVRVRREQFLKENSR